MSCCMHCVFLQGYCTPLFIGLALDICLSYESITKQAIFWSTFFSIAEAFEFCWSSFTDEHNTYLKSTRRNVKLNKFAFGTQGIPDLS